VQKSTHILKHIHNQLDIVAIQIINQILNTIHGLIGLDNLKLSKLANIFHDPAFLIVDHKSTGNIILDFLVLPKYQIIYSLSDIFEVQVYDRDHSAKIGSDQVILFTVL